LASITVLQVLTFAAGLRRQFKGNQFSVSLAKLTSRTDGVLRGTTVFSRPLQLKIEQVGKAVRSLPPKLLKIRYALIVHLGPRTHLPLRAVSLIFL
jgi:hypothetical protein